MFSIENTSLFKALSCLTGFSKDLRAHNNELGFITQTTAERNKVYIFTSKYTNDLKIVISNHNSFIKRGWGIRCDTLAIFVPF